MTFTFFLCFVEDSLWFCKSQPRSFTHIFNIKLYLFYNINAVVQESLEICCNTYYCVFRLDGGRERFLNITKWFLQPYSIQTQLRSVLAYFDLISEPNEQTVPLIKSKLAALLIKLRHYINKKCSALKLEPDPPSLESR